MELQIAIMKNAAELETTQPFVIDSFLWGTESIPRTYGYLGYVPDDGFYLKMVCEEENPLRTYTEYQSPVCLDSAMEAFLMFGGGSDPEPVYLNLEANANGALLAEYGTERNGRIRFSREEGEAFGCRTGIRDGQWTLFLRLPLAVLDRIYGRKLDLQEGSRFSCNFYKVCETEGAGMHYASLFPVRSEKPDFHRPQDFGGAVLRKTAKLL